MGRFSGVTLDFYDDKGETLKSRFPTPESLPDIIKTADVRPRERVPNEDYALVATDRGHLMRKFACNDQGTTAMSVMYFMEHGDKLPHNAVKTAAANLLDKCIAFGLLPPVELTKKAAYEHPVNIVDLTGQTPEPVVKVAKSDKDEDYAVVDGDRRMYPIHTWDLMKTASLYYEENRCRMEPEVRRQFAVKLANKARQIGYPIDGDVFDSGSETYANPGHMKAAIEMRKVAFSPNSKERTLLDDLFEKRASVEPDEYAQALNYFDRQTGVSKLWDSACLDPWASTFGLIKTGTEVVWEDPSGSRVTRDELENLSKNKIPLLTKTFTDDFAHEFLKDPVGIFKSMPLPQKKCIARMAADSSADGSSEG